MGLTGDSMIQCYLGETSKLAAAGCSWLLNMGAAAIAFLLSPLKIPPVRIYLFISKQ